MKSPLTFLKFLTSFAAAGLVLSVFAACSSAPPAPDRVVERKNRAADYTNFGNTYYEQANFAQSLDFFQLALETNIAVDNQEGAAVSYNSIGKTLLALGRLDEAQAACLEASSIARSLGLAPLLYQSANNLSEVYMRRGQNKEALQLLQETLKSVPSGEGSKEQAVFFHGMGVVQRNLALEGKALDTGVLQQALVSFDKAQAINKKLNLKNEVASNFYMKARAQMDLQNYAMAETEIQTALALDREMENSLGIGLDLRLLGRLRLIDHKNTEAWDLFLRSYKVFQAIAHKEQQLRTLDFILPLAAEMKKTDEQAFYSKQKVKLDAKS